ncbi:hypothetical protein ACFQDN_22745 [Pseudomonas asuensis]
MLIRELERSELLIIATPMHRFTVPASLKLGLIMLCASGAPLKPDRSRS